MPREDLGPIESRIPRENVGMPASSSKVADNNPLPFDFGSVGDSWAKLGASNAWVIAKPQTKDEALVNPTLCNDTHLRMAWPSPLYPIQYNLDGKIMATGFTLPGVPGLVLGSLENQVGRRFAWAITLGNYADSQDLIIDRSAKAKVTGKTTERYLVRNTKTAVLDEKVIEEKWSQFGLDVTELFAQEIGIKAPVKVPGERETPPTAVYLDWAGYRQLKNPLDFYLRRNLFLDENLIDEVHNDWDYPVVNFNWMAGNRNGSTEVGHVITGLQFARKRSSNAMSLDADKISTRRVVRLGAERYLHRVLKNDEFFMVSANQKPFNNSDTEDAAYSWESNTRADQIWNSRSAILKKAESEQTDYHSTVLIEFYQRARAKVTANQICQIGTQAERDFCFKLWTKIEKWSGLLSADSFEATVIALWMSLSKQMLFPENYPWTDPAADEFFTDYTQKGFSDLALLQIMRSDQKILEWQKEHKAFFVKRLGELFSKALKILVDGRGPDARLWTWGSVHQLDWYYPLGEAPKPWGAMIEESFLGPRREVGGGFDSPGSFEFQWSPQDPSVFPALHGAAMRACYEFAPGEPTKVRWAAPNGPSGNPFSKWARVFANKSYFKGILLPAENSKSADKK